MRLHSDIPHMMRILRLLAWWHLATHSLLPHPPHSVVLVFLTHTQRLISFRSPFAFTHTCALFAFACFTAWLATSLLCCYALAPFAPGFALRRCPPPLPASLPCPFGGRSAPLSPSLLSPPHLLPTLFCLAAFPFGNCCLLLAFTTSLPLPALHWEGLYR